MSIDLLRLNSSEPEFAGQFEALLSAEAGWDEAVEAQVRGILESVRRDGDAALVELTARFDGHQVAGPEGLIIGPERLEQALATIDQSQRQALEAAAERIRSYHEYQRQESWSYVEPDGTLLGQQVTPLDRAGVYVPGGKAAYPSTVLMNTIPARVAGVDQVIMVVPTPGGELNELMLAAAQIAGVDQVFSIGGAQAVAALAYGTETVPAVDKIVGPGNVYVTTAKRLLFGKVGIDMLAGPSEVVVLCDGSVDPSWIAMDLFAQAEHDEDARSVALCPDADYLSRVAAEVATLLPEMERADVIAASLAARGALIQITDLEEGVDLVNRLAPEHLELAVSDPQALLPGIRHAGAIFLGAYSSEALGDYCAGPNHVLPTARTARFFSPLGVYDFQKRTSLIGCSANGANTLGAIASVLARGEGLTAHARSAEMRLADGGQNRRR